MGHKLQRRNFLKTVTVGGLSLLLPVKSRALNIHAPQEVCFSDFSSAGNQFRIAIFADPQVGHMDDPSPVAVNARRTLKLGVREINAMNPAPLFAVFLGDLVNTFDERSIATFEDCISGIQCTPVLVHGNHDTRPPFTEFRALMQRVSGFDAVSYSFNAGLWHFIVIPCNLSGTEPMYEEAKQEVLAWLDRDLKQNVERPTMVFNHLHLMPQGLTQLEWYCFPLDLRLRLLELFKNHGNVRYFFNGHVHNGLKTSIKTSWQYQGTTFITVPTIIQSRNFGEEYAEFEQGQESGGYFLMVDVNGKDVNLNGRLVGKQEGFQYPRRFRKFHTEIEPRWLNKTTDFKPAKKLLNGNFLRGMHGWTPCYRYQSDSEPGFLWEPARRANRQAVQILTRTKSPVFWANDEMTELYQTVALPDKKDPIFQASYWIDQVVSDGGGYVRLNAIKNNTFKFAMMFRWGRKYESQADILVRSFANSIYGEPRGWLWLQELAKTKKGLFWEVPEEPNRWHRLSVNIARTYDAAMARPGAFQALGITKFYLGLGTWTTKQQNALSSACFTDISLFGGSADSCLDEMDLPVNESVFQNDFASDLQKRTSKKNHKKDT